MNVYRTQVFIESLILSFVGLKGLYTLCIFACKADSTLPLITVFAFVQHILYFELLVRK